MASLSVQVEPSAGSSQVRFSHMLPSSAYRSAWSSRYGISSRTRGKNDGVCAAATVASVSPRADSLAGAADTDSVDGAAASGLDIADSVIGAPAAATGVD